MYNNDNNHYPSSHHNGNHPSIKPTLEEYNPLESEQQNYSEQSSQPLTPKAQKNLRQLRQFYITLIVTGLVLGGLLSWGVASLLNEWDLINPPKQEQFNQDSSGSIL